MTPLIIIPARGGSKGIPRKNIKPLLGKPLIAYSIEVAKEYASRHALSADNIVVSTDDAEIAEVAARLGAPCRYRRPEWLGGDKVGSREVMLDVMDWADREGIDYDSVILLQPTSPMRNIDDVERTAEAYMARRPDMAVTVKEASANPYYNCFESDPETGNLMVSKGEGKLTRRQDAPKAWEFNGAVYVISPDSLRRMPMGEFPLRIGVEMPAERSVDLDTPLDWIVAEAVMNQGRKYADQK